MHSDPEAEQEMPPSEAEGAEIAGLIACNICETIACVIFITDIITSQMHLRSLLFILQDGWTNIKQLPKTIKELLKTISSIKSARKQCKPYTISKLEKARQPL